MQGTLQGVQNTVYSLLEPGLEKNHHVIILSQWVMKAWAWSYSMQPVTLGPRWKVPHSQFHSHLMIPKLCRVLCRVSGVRCTEYSVQSTVSTYTVICKHEQYETAINGVLQSHHEGLGIELFGTTGHSWTQKWEKKLNNCSQKASSWQKMPKLCRVLCRVSGVRCTEYSVQSIVSTYTVLYSVM